MQRYYFISILMLLQSTIIFGQVNHKKAVQVALKRAKIGKEIIFSRSKRSDYDSLVLVYLEEIKTIKGRHLKILTSRWYWGSSPRATSRILIFSRRNQYLGDYRLTMTYEVPDKVEGTSLVFINDKDSDCTPSLVNVLNFKKGIPQKFFLKCKGANGDLYDLSQELAGFY